MLPKAISNCVKISYLYIEQKNYDHDFCKNSAALSLTNKGILHLSQQHLIIKF